MMAPDYTHWHGMYEVAQRFYMELLPQARERVAEAVSAGKTAQAEAVTQVLEAIVARPEHRWVREGAEEQAEQIRQGMEKRYGQSGHGTR